MHDTLDLTRPIAALATPRGRGGVAMVRVSGTDLLPRLLPLLRLRSGRPAGLGDFVPGRMRLFTLWDDQADMALDHPLVVYFRAPHSFTGEDVVEIHCHGSPVLVDHLLTLLWDLGVHPAEPGEFSRRAFVNGRMDLLQAEALQRMIHAATPRALRASARMLDGELSRLLDSMRVGLLEVLAHLEAGIDFSEEEIEPDSLERLSRRLRAWMGGLQPWVTSSSLAMRVQDGVQVTLAGRPNAGKSSLFNRLARMDRSIVSPHPGTTRDYIEVTLEVEGIPVRLVDTAGLRDCTDHVESEGVRRSRAQMERSDMLLLVVDGMEGLSGEELELLAARNDQPVLLVWNKVDVEGVASPPDLQVPVVSVSCHTGVGLEALHGWMVGHLGATGEDEGALLVAPRQVAQVRALMASLEAAVRHGDSEAFAPELMVLELRGAVQALGALTGAIHHGELLDTLFSSFCIGK